jgi:hypothetical protein
MKTLELYLEEPLVLVIKEKKTFHTMTNKGIDKIIEVYLLAYNSKELKQKRLDIDLNPKSK